MATRRDQRLTWMYGENIYKLLQLFHEESTQYSHHRGQIAIVSSVASFLGMPWAPAYCATKAAIRIWGEALRGHLFPDGVEVSVICPGFVRSRMTIDNPYPMPFLMNSAKAARIIRKGLERNKPRIIFPWPMAVAVWMATIMPPSLMDPLMRQLPKKV